MYVDVDRRGTAGCNTFAFQLGDVGVGAAIATRMWSIRVTQYACDSPVKAPDGCTQYFFDPTGTGVVKTYNFDGGQHLANQKQTICVRRERGNCRICWSTEKATDFAVSGTYSTSTGNGFTLSTKCCGYTSTAGGYDCVQIPGALKSVLNSMGSYSFVSNSRFCGRDAGLVSTDANTVKFATMDITKTICSTRTPFLIRFLSDGYEYADGAALEAMKTNAGFKLTYTQDATDC